MTLHDKGLRLFQYALIISGICYLLTIVPNSLYTNGLVFERIYLPFEARVDYAKEFNRYAIDIHDADYIIKTNSIYIYDDRQNIVDTIIVDDVTEYGFNYDALLIKVWDSESNVFWLKPQKLNKMSRRIEFLKEDIDATQNRPKMIWINLAEQWRGWKKYDLLNRLFVLPIIWLSAVILLIMNYFSKKKSGAAYSKKEHLVGILTVFFPLIIFLLRDCVFFLWRMALWGYTMI